MQRHELFGLVAGATRGAGRGIARAFGERGASVFCTGRSSRETGTSPSGRPETIEETAELVDREGDGGLVVQVTDGAFQGYRGQLFDDLCKASAMRLAYGMSVGRFAGRTLAGWDLARE